MYIFLSTHIFDNTFSGIFKNPIEIAGRNVEISKIYDRETNVNIKYQLL